MGTTARISYKGHELLPIKRDIVFKAVFIIDGDLELLASLISSILGIEMKAEDMEVTNTELPAAYEQDKLSRMDIRVKTKDNKHINIEIQISNEHDMAKRSLKYLSKMYTEQMVSGMDYVDAGRAIAINILDFKFSRSEKYHTQFRMMETEEGYELTDVFEINYIELPKASRVTDGNMKDKWVKFMSADSEEVLEMLAEESPIFAKAIDKLVYVSADERVRFELEMREKAESDYHSGLKSSFRKGREQGIQQGIQQGMEQGRAVGSEEKAIEMVKKMISQKLPAEVIAQIAGMPIERIEMMYKIAD